MPSKQRQRFKRREIAQIRSSRRKAESNVTGLIDGDPIFTEEDLAYEDDDRIVKLLQRKHPIGKDAIYLTDLLDFDDETQNITNEDKEIIDNNNNNNIDNITHQQMLEDIFGNTDPIEPKIMGSHLSDSAFDIHHTNTTIADINSRDIIDYQNSFKKVQGSDNDINNINGLNKRVTMTDMIKNLSIPINKLVSKQIIEFEDSQEIARLKLHAQTKISPLTIKRKERGIEMNKTKEILKEWAIPISQKKEILSNKKNLIPPKPNMVTFLDQMEWTGDLGNELSIILDDYKKEHDLDNELIINNNKPTKYELINQSKKMSNMRRKISNQIKEFRRLKKIKSRSFRRRLRKRKSKIQPSLEELSELDPKLYKREIFKLQKQHAEERITLRHKNTSKWAQHILRRGNNNKNKINLQSRKELMEQLQRGLELKRKIRGHTQNAIGGNDDDSDDSANYDSDNNNNKKRNSKNGKFETEKQEVSRQLAEKEEEISKSGVWGMKFMKRAEGRRKAQINAITEKAKEAKQMRHFDKYEKQIDIIQENAVKVNPLINSSDDPIGASLYYKKHKNDDNDGLSDKTSGLGKRRFGFTDASKRANIVFDKENNSTKKNNEPPTKKQRLMKILPLETQLVKNTQQIDESAFGITTKSIMRLDVENENENDKDNDLVTEDTLKAKSMLEPIFEMIEFPKHNAKISQTKNKNHKNNDEINNDNNQKIDGLDGNKYTAHSYYDRIRNDNQIKHKKTYFPNGNENVNDNNDKKEEEEPILDIGKFLENEEAKNDTKDNDNDVNNTGDDEWEVFVPADQSVHKPILQNKNNQSNKKKLKVSFNVKKNKLHNKQKYKQKQKQIESKKLKSQSNKLNRVNHSRFENDNNPWLQKLKKPKDIVINTLNNNDSKIGNLGQKETTILDPNIMLLPKQERHQPDFNLLASNDPKQIELIYQTLHGNNNNNNTETKPIFTDINDNEKNFLAMKEDMISSSMMDKPDGPLLGWDSWTGLGIKNNYKNDIDPVYTQDMAEWKKEREKRLLTRNDGHLDNVILSDYISKESSKYVVRARNRPEWFQPWRYRVKMSESIGREWNLSSEFFDTIRDNVDLPQGYIVKPTKRQDNREAQMTSKTHFGNRKKQKLTNRLSKISENSTSMYESMNKESNRNKRRPKDFGPDREKIL